MRNLVTELAPSTPGDFVSFADPGPDEPPLTRATTASELLYSVRTKQVACTFTAIVGFREYIFSAASGALGKFAAATEYTFGTITQRTLTHPGRIRLHYGHPDLFNKVCMCVCAFWGVGGACRATQTALYACACVAWRGAGSSLTAATAVIYGHCCGFEA